jgi:enamine deaminase RidA (YjgF/YER057c/UK114 family)
MVTKLTINSKRRGAKPLVSQFSTLYGSETFIALESPIKKASQTDILALFREYSEVLKNLGLSSETEIFIRFHLSDIVNQAPLIHRLLMNREIVSFLSIVGQPPASGKRCALQAYHIKANKPVIKIKKSDNMISVKHGRYTSIWTKSIPSAQHRSIPHQTNQVFHNLSDNLAKQGATLHKHLVRTWIFIRDIDNHYHEFANARRVFYSNAGLTKETHTPVSTGIGGTCEKSSHLLFMDSLAVIGLGEEQIEYMSALEYLCPPYVYDVTFERASRIFYGDRIHYYISGTASIDSEGNVFGAGNVQKQAMRTFKNISALLSAYGAELEDLRLLVVYLRDMADFFTVNSFLREHLPSGVSYIVVRGKICRTPWLIEMDGIAIKPAKDNRFAPYC